MALGFKHSRILHLVVPRINIALYSMFTVQASAHSSLHGLYEHDSEDIASSASDKGALFDMSSTASTCTVPHKSEFSVPSRWTPMPISHKEHVRHLWRIWKRMQNSVWGNDNLQKEHRSVVLPPFGVFGCHQSKRKLVSRNRAELPSQRTRVRRDRGFVLLALKGEHVQHRQLRLKMLMEWDSLSE